MDKRLEMIHFVDQVAAMASDLFKEQGYDVEVGIPEELRCDEESMTLGFVMISTGFRLPSQQVIDEVMQEAIERTGAERDEEMGY